MWKRWKQKNCHFSSQNNLLIIEIMIKKRGALRAVRNGRVVGIFKKPVKIQWKHKKWRVGFSENLWYGGWYWKYCSPTPAELPNSCTKHVPCVWSLLLHNYFISHKFYFKIETCSCSNGTSFYWFELKIIVLYFIFCLWMISSCFPFY